MIRNFRHRGLKRLFEQQDRSRVNAVDAEKIERILTHLDNAPTVRHMALPRFHLHPMKANYKGFWSVTVRANWRVIFRFKDGDAFDVDLVDYH